MQIETFEIEERDLETPCEEIEAAALDLIRELGLKGQANLCKEDNSGTTTSRIPYPKMTVYEGVVYGTLFTQHTNYEKYDAGIIPLRVLQVIKHARELFEDLEVWHSPTVADPILIGKRNRPNGGSDPYLLARWGEALESFEVLTKKARTMLKTEFKSRCEETMARCEAVLKSLDAQVEKKLRGDWVHIPS